MFATEWESLYQKGEQLNAFPYTEVVSFLHKYKKIMPEGNVLDVGCGSGVHAALFAEYGFTVDAFDASQSAIEFAKSKYKDFSRINFVTSTTDDFVPVIQYDLVLDRLCTSQTGLLSTKRFYDRLAQYLNTDGTVFWQGFCDTNSGKNYADFYDAENGYWDNFSGGEFEDLGCTTFFTPSDVESVFEKYELIEFREISDKNQKSGYLRNHWYVEARLR